MNSYIPEKIKRMKEYIPDTSCPDIKLDANESPYPTPEKVLNAIKNSIDLDSLNRYPDPDMKELLASYGRFVGVSPDRLVAGDGSDELIALIINTFLADGGKILITEPDFSMYAFYADFAGAQTVRYRKKDGIDTDISELKALIKEENVRLVLFSNPCNPTGEMLSAEEIKALMDGSDALFVVDEAYMEFAPRSESVIALTEKTDNLIVLKTVSKIGLAGLRCGFAVSNTELIAALKKTKSPYNLNSVTQKAVAVAMDNYAEIGENVEKIKAAVTLTYEKLKKYEDTLGFEMRRGNGNFVYLRFKENGGAAKVHSFLKENGISVRLMGNCLRITAGTAEEVEALDLCLVSLK